MIKRLLLALPLMMAVHTYAGDKQSSNTGIQFQELSLKDAMAKAKKEHKLIFVDVYTTWCGPCKLLKKNTFPDKTLGEYYNKNFISIAADAEKGEWIKFADDHRVQGYPTMMILDAEGKEIDRTVGYMPAEPLLKFGADTKAKAK